MKVFLAGATGAIGRQLVPALIEAGHRVSGISRTEPGAALLRAQGASAAVCDVFDNEGLAAVMQDTKPDAVIHQMTAIPAMMSPRRIAKDLAATNRLRESGTTLLMDAAVAAGARKFIAQSISFIYSPGNPTPATEDEPLYLDAPRMYRPMVDAVQACERTTLDTPGIEGTVLRYGYFYGPGTIYARDGSFTEGVRRGRIPLVGAGSGVYSFVHIRDAATATVAALDVAGGTYNIVDDEPAPVSEWLPYFAALLGARVPARVPAILGRIVGGSYLSYLMNEQRGASNALAKSRLGWQPLFPSWRTGFPADLEYDPEQRSRMP